MTIERKEEFAFVHIVADEGKMLTDWKEDYDIKYFSASQQIYCPLGRNIEEFREISVEEAERLEAQKQEAFEKERADAMAEQMNKREIE